MGFALSCLRRDQAGERYRPNSKRELWTRIEAAAKWTYSLENKIHSLETRLVELNGIKIALLEQHQCRVSELEREKEVLQKQLEIARQEALLSQQRSDNIKGRFVEACYERDVAHCRLEELMEQFTNLEVDKNRSTNEKEMQEMKV